MRLIQCTDVVDVLIENTNAKVLAVGEVKPALPADCQVLAPLIMEKDKRGVCPVGKLFLHNEEGYRDMAHYEKQGKQEAAYPIPISLPPCLTVL